MDEVNVSLPNGRYTIHIADGILTRIGELLQLSCVPGKGLIISDTHVAQLYGQGVLTAMQQAGWQVEMMVVAPGEDSKSLTTAMDIYTKAIGMSLDRKSTIIALGGGVVGDLAGFIAATYLRGVPFVQIPTTLLAQVDSSVGGKVAVNHPLGKNLIGAFYQPLAVIADIGLLATLPPREWSTGLAEVVKHGIIADAGYFEFIDSQQMAVAARQPAALSEIVRGSCEIKARVVEQDERESHLRMMLNFGHTIGHAVEGDTGYSQYNHGEAVAIGMHGAALLSYHLGLCSADTLGKVKDVLAFYKLPLTAPQCSPEGLQAFLVRDKKSVQGKINWVLVKTIGQVVISDQVPDAVLQQVLTEITATS